MEGVGTTASDTMQKMPARQPSSQFLTSATVWPYLFPAYGLFHLAAGLEVGVKVPDWYQLIRAAVVVTAKVEDLVSVCCDLRVLAPHSRPTNLVEGRTGGQTPVTKV